MKRFTFPKF